MKMDAAKQEPLVAVIAAMLQETVERNDRSNKQSTLSSFCGRRPPLAAAAFVTRVAKYSGASPCCFAVGLIYLERMKKRDASVCLTSANFQRLFLVSVMCASKFLDDFYYSNKHWAEVGGLQTAELNKLEIEFLFRMGFSLHMQREEYDWYAEELHSRVRPEHLCEPAAAEQAPERDAQAPDRALGRWGSDPRHAVDKMHALERSDVDSTLSASTTPSSSTVACLQAHGVGQMAFHGVHSQVNFQTMFPQPQDDEGGGNLQQQFPGVNPRMDWVYC